MSLCPLGICSLISPCHSRVRWCECIYLDPNYSRPHHDVRGLRFTRNLPIVGNRHITHCAKRSSPANEEWASTEPCLGCKLATATPRPTLTILHSADKSVRRIRTIITPWPDYASELYWTSDRRLSAKLVPTFAYKGISCGQRGSSLRP
jgi:hypothetical protein